MRFYLDENLSQQIAVIARRLGVDVTSAQELGRRGLSDEEQLAFAAAEGRCLVTQDYGDFRRRSDEFREQGQAHSGVLFVPRSLSARRFAAVAAALDRYHSRRPEGMLPYESGWLSERWDDS